MPQLERIRLVNVGYPSGRYADETLEFVDEAGRPTHTAINLTNGGGKTTAISLYYALLKPGQRHFISKDRSISEYVPSGSAAFVITEWRVQKSDARDQQRTLHQGEPPRYLLGAYHEHTRAGFSTTYFSIQHDIDIPQTSIQAFPLTQPHDSSVRLITRTELISALNDINARARGPQPARYFDTQTSWVQHLQYDLGFNPDLITLQARMNHQESGGIAQTLALFKNDSDYLRFLLSHTLPHGTIERFREAYDQHREDIGNLYTRDEPTLKLSKALIGIAELLTRGADARTAEEQSRSAAISAFHQHRARSHALTQHIDDAIDRNGAEREQYASERERIERGIAEQDWRFAAAKHQSALLNAVQSEGAYRQAKDEADTAEADVRAWARAEKLAAVQRAHTRLNSTEDEIRALATKPDSITTAARRAEAARRYAEALKHTQNTKEHHHNTTTAAHQEAEREHHEHIDAHGANLAELATLNERIKQHEAAIEHINTKQRELERRNIIPAGLTPNDALERANEALSETRSQRNAILSDIDDTKRAQSASAAAVTSARAALDEAKLEHRSSSESLERALKARHLAASAIREITPDAWSDDDREDQLAQELERAERAHDEQRASADRALERAREQHEALTRYGLLPPHESVAHALAIMRDAGVSGARVANEYIAEQTQHADADSAREHARNAPLAPHTIIVPPHQRSRATEALEQRQQELNIPILISGAQSLQQPHATDTTSTLIGPGDLTRYHYPSAQEHIRTSATTLDALELKHATARDQHRLIQTANNAYKQYRNQYAPGAISELKRNHDSNSETLSAAETSHDTVTAADTQLRAALEELNAKERELSNALSAAEGTHRTLEEFVHGPHAEARAHSEEQAQAAAQRNHTQQALKDSQQRLRTAEEALRDAARALDRSGIDLAAHNALLKDHLSAYDLDLRDIRAVEGDTGLLREQLDDAEAAYHNTITNATLNARREEQRQALQAARKQLNAYEHSSDTEAQARLDTLNNHEPNTLQQAKEAAENRHQTAIGTRATAEAETRAARALVRETQTALDATPNPSDCTLPADLVTRSDIETFIQDHHNQRAELTTLLAHVNDHIQRNAQERERLKEHKSALQSIAAKLSASHPMLYKLDLPMGHTTPPSGDDLSTAIAALDASTQATLDQLAENDEVLKRLDEKRAQHARAFRNALDDARYEQVMVMQRKRLKEYDNEALEKHSREILTQLQDLAAHTAAHINRVKNENLSILLNTLNAIVLRAYRVIDTVNKTAKLEDGQKLLTINLDKIKNDSDRLPVLELFLKGRIGAGHTPSSAALDGAQLVLDAVRACITRLSITFAHPDLRNKQTLTVPEILKKSGGERLTMALMTYFVLANAAEDTTNDTSNGGTTLWLDNPFGEATRPDFIALQTAFATQAGIQLIYSTAINDYDALAAFPNTIWLSNNRGAHITRTANTISQARMILTTAPNDAKHAP